MKIKRPHAELLFLMALSLFLLLAGAPHAVVMIVNVLLVINFALAGKWKPETLGLTRKGIWPSIKVQLPFTIIGSAGLLACALIIGRGISVPNENFIAYWLVSVPLQEFLFRGYVQSVLRKFLKPLNTALLASALFAAMHFFNPVPYMLVLVTTTFASGLAWGLAYEKERNLIGPIVSHEILGTIMLLMLA
jgi:membrane protease YdiL (CAAX protease family)